MLNGARARAKRKGIPFTLTLSDVSLPARCPVLGIPLGAGEGDNAPTLDRVVPALGYTPGNVLVVSMRANRIKSDATVGELQRVADFYTFWIKENHREP